MTTYAAAIAAGLQGREDEDMGKDESVEHELDDVMKHLNAARKFLYIVMTGRTDPDEDAGRVAVERELVLERERANGLDRDFQDALVRAEKAEARVEELEPFLAVVPCSNPSEHETLATAYVAREVPWTDVAAGMMTIARDGTPWMVEQVLDHDMPIAFRLRNGGQTFTKTIDPGPVDTVRVLVPYVTDEQARGLVASVLGGTEVGS